MGFGFFEKILATNFNEISEENAKLTLPSNFALNFFTFLFIGLFLYKNPIELHFITEFIENNIYAINSVIYFWEHTLLFGVFALAIEYVLNFTNERYIYARSKEFCALKEVVYNFIMIVNFAIATMLILYLNSADVYSVININLSWLQTGFLAITIIYAIFASCIGRMINSILTHDYNLAVRLKWFWISNERKYLVITIKTIAISLIYMSIILSILATIQIASL